MERKIGGMERDIKCEKMDRKIGGMERDIKCEKSEEQEGWRGKGGGH